MENLGTLPIFLRRNLGDIREISTFYSYREFHNFTDVPKVPW